MRHEDFCGHKGTIGPGDLQVKAFGGVIVIKIDFRKRGQRVGVFVPKIDTGISFQLNQN